MLICIDKNMNVVTSKMVRRLNLFVVLTFLLLDAGPQVPFGDGFTLPDVGGLTPWGTWSACDKTCGGGTQTRVRTCTDPPPSSGGMPCVRHTEEQARLCHNADCPDLTYFEQNCLEAHNFYRAKHGVPPLTWNNDLKDAARKWSVHLFNFEIHLVHDEITLQRTFQGENLGKYVTDPAIPLCKNKTDTANDCVQCHDVIKLWYEEHIHYNFTSGTGLGTGEILHLTQLLWKSTSQLGMAVIRGKFELILVARYYIGGNFVTPYDFMENVPPPLQEPWPPSTAPEPTRPSSTDASQTSNMLATQMSSLAPTYSKFIRASNHPTVTSSAAVTSSTPALNQTPTISTVASTALMLTSTSMTSASTTSSITATVVSKTPSVASTSTFVSTISNVAPKTPTLRSITSPVASTTTTTTTAEQAKSTVVSTTSMLTSATLIVASTTSTVALKTSMTTSIPLTVVPGTSTVASTRPTEVLTISPEVSTIPTLVSTTPTEVSTTSITVSKSPTEVSTTSTLVSITPTEVSTTSTTMSTTPTEVSTTSTAVSTTPTEVSKTSPVVSTTPTEVSTTSTAVSTTPIEVSTTSTAVSTTPNEVSTTVASVESTKEPTTATSMPPTTLTVVSTTENPTTSESFQGNCKNDFEWCEEYAAEGYCVGPFGVFMLVWCKEACGGCM